MTTLQEMYASLGIDAQVLAFGEHILENLKDRFAAIDETAEYNQLKVIRAMQKARVSEACLLGTTGYGYNDIGRDTLEEVYDHILEITVDNMRTRALLSGQEGEIETLPSPMEAFREFYQIMQQQPLSEEEEAVIQEILVKIGGETE